MGSRQSTALALPDTMPAAMRKAIVDAARSVPQEHRFYFFMGALFGATQLENGRDTSEQPVFDYPGFRKGRDLVVNFKAR